MATTHHSDPTTADTQQTSTLRVSPYERASSFLMSLLLLTGVAAITLFAIWISTVVVSVRIPKPIKHVPLPHGRGDHDPGFAKDPEGPGAEELDIVLDEPIMPASLEPVSNLASIVEASYDATDADDFLSGTGSGGRGDWRRRGPPGDGQNVVPPWERWEVRYQSADETEYRRQLDFFGVEIAAAGGSKFVDYAYNVSQSPISTRKGESKREQRVYLIWKPGSQLRQFDEAILDEAGIEHKNRIVMQFLPQSIYDRLHQLEVSNTDRHPTEWLKTYFKIRKTRSGYEFYIEKQLFRPRPVNAQTS